jgi:hypothetical protein
MNNARLNRALALADAQAGPSSRRWSSRVRSAGVLLGAILLMAAIVLVWRQRDVLPQALNSIQHLPAGRLALDLAVVSGTIAANIALSGVVFSLLMSRYGRVGVLEMQALIASATLLNFLPLRPGFFGRIAYHRLHNDIAVRDSAKAVVQAVCISALIAIYLTAAMVLARMEWASLLLLAGSPPLLLGLAGVWVTRARVWLWAAATRCIEVLLSAARYWAAFELVGSAIEPAEALGFACLSVIATMIPFSSNGLGLREWAVGFAAPALTAHQMEVGIAADLLNRAAELVIVLVCGLAGMAYLARRRYASHGSS